MIQIILYGIGISVSAALVWWLCLTIKAMKDPDVQAASELRMTIGRFRKYQKLYDEYQDFMKTNGVDSDASMKKFGEIFEQIDNPNEWRRYQDYRYQKSREEFWSDFNDFSNA